jgi:hypothetical protein
MTAESLRTEVFDYLVARGFYPAGSLPLPNLNAPTRTPEEIAARLMALDALFTWVAFSEEAVASERVKEYAARNQLQEWLTKSEDEIIALPRAEAYASHVDTIGWKLENMWPLAWALGFEPEPTIEASPIDEAITHPMIYEFLPGLSATIDDLLAKAKPRGANEVIALEYRFYCAHNAVRSAQLGEETVPHGFHPIVHGGVVHERRHALSWCIAPDISWDETDLST